MRIKNLFENLERTGEGKSAVVGWGRGMGHKGHMFLASSVVTHANDLSADPYFVVSKTVGKDDPITPEEKLEIYKKVFPEKGHIFQTATEEMPDLTRVLTKLNELGYENVTVVVGEDQKKALSYVMNYNGKPDKKGNVPYNFKELNVISRQETSDPSAGEEGPRATPMRDILKDPKSSEEEKFNLWRSSMSPELSDDEVRDLMMKASQRMSDFTGKKEKVSEAVSPDQFKKTMLSEVRAMMTEMRNDPEISLLLEHSVAESKPKGYDSEGNPLGGGYDEYDNSKKSWTVVVNGKAWKTFDNEKQAYKAADSIQQKYGKKTRVVSEELSETARLSTREKFKRSLKRAGYDADAGAKRIEDLLAKQKKEREEFEKKYSSAYDSKDEVKEATKSEPPKPRNFVAKNAKTAGAGAHKDAKKAAKDVRGQKHKAKSIPLDESRWGPAMKFYAKRNMP